MIPMALSAQREPPMAARVLAWLLLALALSTTASMGQAETGLVRFQFAPQHQAASTLAPEVLSFLGTAGSVEIRGTGNILIVTDTPDRIAKIVPLLRHLDRPRSAVEVSVRLVRGWRAAVSGEPAPVLPADLEGRLAKLLPGRRYELLGQRTSRAIEGSPVEVALGSDLQLRFEVGTVLAGRRLRLGNFTLARATSNKTLMQGDVNLWVDRPVAIALSETTGPESLVLVVEAKILPSVGGLTSGPAVGGDPTRRPAVGGDPTVPRNR
jgi:hypothetical protein